MRALRKDMAGSRASTRQMLSSITGQSQWPGPRGRSDWRVTPLFAERQDREGSRSGLGVESEGSGTTD